MSFFFFFFFNEKESVYLLVLSSQEKCIEGNSLSTNNVCVCSVSSIPVTLLGHVFGHGVVEDNCMCNSKRE